MSTVAKDFKVDENKKKTEVSFQIGLELGKKAIEKGIKEVCFDRSGYLFHGRVKALANGARKAGLKF
jgi:large subunit ribosomal protein L18